MRSATGGATGGSTGGATGGATGGLTGGVLAAGVSGSGFASAVTWRLPSPIKEPAGKICILSIQGLIIVDAAPIQAFAPIAPEPTINTPAPRITPAPTSRVP